jgi:hypothetical protein
MTKIQHKEYAVAKIDPPKLGQFKHMRKNIVNVTIDKIN